MSSLKQKNANQLNAEKSTGPKTEEGKAVVAKNAIRHGLLASQSLLPWEESKSLEELGRNLRTELQPKGELEVILIDRIVSLIWRLRRAGKIETAIFAWKQYESDLEHAETEAASHVERKSNYDELLASLSKEKVSTKITNKDKYEEAVKKRDEAESLKNGAGPTLGRNFIAQAENFNTLHRYETTLERSLFKALHELQRVQAMRLGMNVPLPLTVDVHGDGKEI